MTILAFCPDCKSYVSRKNEKCKCGSRLSSCTKFRVNVTNFEGSRVTKVVEGNLTLARRVEAKIKTDIIQKKHLGIHSSPYLKDVWEKFLKWSMKNKKSWYDDQNRWELHVKPNIGSKKMDEVTTGQIKKILDGMNEKERAPATIKQVFSLIKRVYNWSIENDLYHGKNPTNKIKAPRVDNKVTECLTNVELENLIETLERWKNRLAALIVKFALFTGLRQDEILGLRWSDIDQERGFLTLRDPKGKPTTLPLSEPSLAIIGQAGDLKPFPECIYVFPNTDGKRRVSFYKIWSRIRDAAGLPKKFRFHGLRHTFASYLASSGEVDLYTLQKLLNHQDPKMTQRYAHLLDEALRRGANVAGKVFGKP